MPLSKQSCFAEGDAREGGRVARGHNSDSSSDGCAEPDVPISQLAFCAKGNPLGRETLGGGNMTSSITLPAWHLFPTSTHFVFKVKSGHFLPFSLPCSNVTKKRLHSTSSASKGLETCSNKPRSYPLNMTGLTSPFFTRVWFCSP